MYYDGIIYRYLLTLYNEKKKIGIVSLPENENNISS